MKRILSVLVAVMMLVCAMALSASAAQVYNAVYGVATIDGIVSAGEWDEAVAVEMAVKTNPGKELPANPTMQVMHDGTNMYILVTGPAPSADANVFVCLHLPHAGCELDGCQSYLKTVVDGDTVAKNGDNCFWTYQKDENMDGVSDFAEGTNGGKVYVGDVAYSYIDGIFTAELMVKANYGKAIPEGAASFDLRLDNDTCWATHQWANQMRTWDPTFNPAWDGGTLYFLAEGEEAPAETTPVVTEPATEEVTEPATEATEEVTEPATEATEEATEPATEKATEKADEPAVTTGADEEPVDDKGGISPIVWVVIAVVVVAAVVAGVVIAKKKKN